MSEKTRGAAGGGRAENGQFTAGNGGGPGNPYARRTAALRKAAADSATEQDVAEVMAALKLGAKAGDVAAARLWLAYAAGRPGPSADPDTLDAHELEVRRQNVATQEDVKALLERAPASLMCELAGAVAPHVRQAMTRMLADGLRPSGETQPAPRVPPSAPLPGGWAKLFEACSNNVFRGPEGEPCTLAPTTPPADPHRARSAADSRPSSASAPKAAHGVPNAPPPGTTIAASRCREPIPNGKRGGGEDESGPRPLAPAPEAEPTGQTRARP